MTISSAPFAMACPVKYRQTVNDFEFTTCRILNIAIYSKTILQRRRNNILLLQIRRNGSGGCGLLHIPMSLRILSFFIRF
jgi:hypothetical protein